MEFLITMCITTNLIHDHLDNVLSKTDSSNIGLHKK